jgi:hypothetical protein
LHIKPSNDTGRARQRPRGCAHPVNDAAKTALVRIDGPDKSSAIRFIRIKIPQARLTGLETLNVRNTKRAHAGKLDE